MATSQETHHYTAAELASLRDSLSESRFATYLKAGGHDERYAMALYLYNARLAKAFLYPLQVAEVTLRNGVDQVLVRVFGADWQNAPAFRTLLNKKGEASLELAIDRANKVAADAAVVRAKVRGAAAQAVRAAVAPAARSQVVAALTFDFWSNLFRPEYEAALWTPHLNLALPQLPAGWDRTHVQDLVKAIGTLRNRIAHHEPILNHDLDVRHKRILSLIEMRCPVTAYWTKQHSTVVATIYARPTLAGSQGATLADVCDPKFVSAAPADALDYVMAQFGSAPATVVVRDVDGALVAAVTPDQMAAYIAAVAVPLDGMVALKDHTITDVVGTIVAPTWIVMTSETEKVKLGALFKKTGCAVIVVMDAAAAISGVIVRAHRRY